MKKAFDQTVRDIKREVNKKVLKVPSIEQKVLDATSNEPWGPHGSLLADIAQATKNYHEYQMIMSVLWKRINDTGKNWRHVYKALTVLEYLVAHGSERVIDEIREHAYQISTLSDFQYIDSSGRDQGNNVRKKSQSLVVLVNDKERIQEVRQKAASNKDKYQNTSTGNMYRPGSFSTSGGYGDRFDEDRYEGRYGNRDDDHNGNGRERDWSSRDESRYGKYGDSYGREGERYNRDYEERYGRDGYKDDDYRGRGQNVDDYQYGSRSRSVDGDRERGYEDDGQYSSRGSGAKADDHSQDGSTTGKRIDRKYSEQNLSAPPSYEEAVNTTHSPSYSERDAESSTAFAPKVSSPPTGAGPSPPITAAAPPPVPSSPPVPHSAPDSNQEVGGFDEFDPRGSFSAAPTTSVGAALATSSDAHMDPLGFLSESFSSNSLALVPAIQPVMNPEVNASANFNSGPTSVAASSAFTNANQPFDDPFGDGPFKAVSSSNDVPAEQQIIASANSFVTNYSQSLDMPQPVPQKVASESGNTQYNATYLPSGPGQPSPANTQFVQQQLPPPNQDIDILADILPPSASLSFVSGQTDNQVLASQSVSHANLLASQSNAPQNSFQAQTGQPTGFPTQLGIHSSQTSYPLQSAESVSQTGFLAQSMALTYPVQAGPASQMGFHSQTGQPTSLSGFPSQVSYSQAGVQASLSGQSTTSNPNYYGTYNGIVPPNGQSAQNNFLSQPGSAISITSHISPQAPLVRPSSSIAQVSTIPTSTGSSAIVPQPSKDKFETKSSVWADTLSRGLVNLNISGPKTNPLADIGVDFDAINRKEKRMEKPTTATVTSTVAMGKAMGSGSGMGRAGATVLRPPPNPMMAPGPSGGTVVGMGMGMGMGLGMGMGMGGYGVSQPMGRPMNMPGTMGMNMGTGQGIHQMSQQTMNIPGSTMPGGYNPMMGTGNYSQQPYGGGYR